MTHFVIPLAGAGQRFRDIGVLSPKWSLKINNVAILELAIKSLPLEGTDTLTLIVLEKHRKVLERMVQGFQAIPLNPEILSIEEVLNGQALTVLKAIELSEVINNSNLVIWCGDCFILKNAFTDIPRFGNWLTTTQLVGEHWSFARIDNGLVVETSEKKRISSNASVGLYGFQDAITFTRAIESNKIKNSSAEIYVAPLYNELIHLGLQVGLHEIKSDFFVSAGTPDEIVKCCNLFDWTMPMEIKDAKS